MNVPELVTLIVAVGGALSSIVAAWRSGQAAQTGQRNNAAIHAVHEAVNGGLAAKIAPVVKEATVAAITDTLLEREEQTPDAKPGAP